MNSINEKIFEKLAVKYNGKYIMITPETSMITIKIQDGPIKEVGINGTQIDMIGKTWHSIIEQFNIMFPCDENEQTMLYIEKALDCQANRTKNRTKRGVEGYNKN